MGGGGGGAHHFNLGFQLVLHGGMTRSQGFFDLGGGEGNDFGEGKHDGDFQGKGKGEGKGRGRGYARSLTHICAHQQHESDRQHDE